MIQQMIEMLDPGAPHVVFEPNGALADGPLAHNRDRYRPRSPWHEDDWPDGEVEWYPGLVSEAKEDGTYAILFDDEDERYGVPRDELRPIFVAGSFDWTHPFVQPDAAETQSSVDDRANSPAPEAIPEES
ncbi:hypothetical protein SO694_00006170 [Aureococcus anophagefferens]|uniref:Uncharacterized protein n=1 Tax=Aureococcus anophagefferens TaxID=44056 RepID=A0ABR1GA22_AURAN